MFVPEKEGLSDGPVRSAQDTVNGSDGRQCFYTQLLHLCRRVSGNT